jgi:S1-C subfamily serine protease
VKTSMVRLLRTAATASAFVFMADRVLAAPATAPLVGFAPDAAVEAARLAEQSRAAGEQARVAGEQARAAGEQARVAGEQGALRAAEQARIEAKLEAARARLEAAANEVAQLSVQMGKPVVQRFSTHTAGAPHSVIGAQIDLRNDSAGARVLDVSPGGAADEAGMRAGDVIVSVNGTDAKGEGGSHRAVRAIQDAAPSARLSVKVLRDGKPKDLVVTARAMDIPPAIVTDRFALFPGAPATAPVYSFRELGIPTLSNMQLATLTPGLGHYFGTQKGVLVVRAPTKSDFQLQDGDVILSIDGREPTSGAHATRILASYQTGEKVTLHIMRDRKPLNLEAKLPEKMWGNWQYEALPRPPQGDGP